MFPRMIAVVLMALVASTRAFAPIQETNCVVTEGSCLNQELAGNGKAFSESAVITVQAYFDGEACQLYRETPLPLSYRQGNTVGEMIVKPEHVQMMASTFNSIGSTVNLGQETGVVARHTYLESSSVPHQDHFAEGAMQGQLVKSSNAFVFLNSNPDAVFFHGDSEGIPAVEGTLVVFDGSVSHFTQVTSGSVHLLGPLNTETMLRVGNKTDTTVDCPKGGFLVGPVCLEFGIFELFLMASGILASFVLCSVGVTPNDS